MTKLDYVTDSYGFEHAIIEHKDGSTTSMLKSIYDAQQAAINE
jgi:hypothetical protein